MTNEAAHDRQSFEAQGLAFLRENIADKPEFDYAENRPPHSSRLAGTTVTLVGRDRPERLLHAFRENQVDVEVTDGPGASGRRTTSYEAFEMAPDVFFVCYLASETGSVAMALDLAKGVATLVRGEMGTDGLVSSVDSALVEVETGVFAGKRPSAGPASYHPSFSLGGTRLLNTYAHNVAYEHIYLTGVYETWLGVKGPEAGQADTEEYHAFKIDDGVYLVYWNEGILTVQMTFLFNFLQGKCVAEVFGRVEGERVHSTIGAKARLIHTKLPELPGVTRLDMYSGD